MKPVLQVNNHPARPTMIYDGDCRFCCLWINRWRVSVGEAVCFLPFQSESLAQDFPDLPVSQCEQAVQFIDERGQVYSGARAVVECLAVRRETLEGKPTQGWGRWGLWAYQLPCVGPALEWLYLRVARNRPVFSWLTRLGWGNETGPSDYRLVRRVFLRALGIVYLIAMASLGSQVVELAGENGLAPARDIIGQYHEQADLNGMGVSRYWMKPTMAWWGQSDGFLRGLCLTGIGLSILLILGIAPALNLVLLWMIYLSLLGVCPLFLGYQWDMLLLEVGLLSIFLAPAQWWPDRAAQRQPSLAAIWLGRWLLFRLMFASGCVKLLSGDVTWADLSALQVHYETQPLPTWIGWYMHQLPLWFHRASSVMMFGIELVVPFLIFLPRRPRMTAAFLISSLMIIIILTGNYGFFNWLALVLCLLLFDDAGLRAMIPRRIRQHGWGFLLAGNHSSAPRPEVRGGFLEKARRLLVGALVLVIVTLSLARMVSMFRPETRWPDSVAWLHKKAYPLHSINQYGLFAVMTTNRMEIVLEGSQDGETWLPYEFPFKPGPLDQAPAFVAPHLPRVDWQMWFAALGTYRNNPWLINGCIQLLHGKGGMADLVSVNPFPDAPPNYVRASFYRYRFTTWKEKSQTGHWWAREAQGFYLPPFSLPEDMKPQKKSDR